MQSHPAIPDGQNLKNLPGAAGGPGQQDRFWYQRNLELSEVYTEQRSIWIIEIRDSGA